MDNILSDASKGVAIKSLQEVRKEAKKTDGEVYQFSFRSVQKPLPFSKRREHVLALEKLFSEIKAAHPSVSTDGLRAKTMQNLSAQAGSDKYDSLYKFVTDTHPRMSLAIMKKDRDPRVMPNIIRMLEVRMREADPSTTKEAGDRLVSDLQNRLFNECLVDKCPEDHYNKEGSA